MQIVDLMMNIGSWFDGMFFSESESFIFSNCVLALNSVQHFDLTLWPLQHRNFSWNHFHDSLRTFWASYGNYLTMKSFTNGNVELFFDCRWSLSSKQCSLRSFVSPLVAIPCSQSSSWISQNNQARVTLLALLSLKRFWTSRNFE